MTGRHELTRRLTWLWLIAAATLVTVSCGQGDQAGIPKASSTGSPEPPLTAPPPPGQPPTTALPGELISIGPAAGQVLGVVGVPFDDVLNVRALPGADQPIVAKLGPLAGKIVAAGATRQLAESIWYEVTVDGVAGWANSRFVAWLTGTDDATAQIIDSLGERPSAATMLDLGRIVAEARASDQPPSRIVVTVAPTTGDLGEVTYDVIGLGDDALLGERLHVFGRPLDGGQGFSLVSVERRLLCARGATADGLCI